MRFTLIISTLLLCISNVRAGEAEELLDKIFVATAEKPERLDRLKTMITKAHGTMFNQKADREFQMSWPSKFRMTTDLYFDSEKRRVNIVMNKEKGWSQRFGQAVVEMTREDLAEFSEGVYIYWLCNLFPLREADTKLTRIPDIQLDSGPAVGLKVSKKGRPDALMYFDKQSLLHVRTAYSSREAGVKILRELSFGKHQAVNGIKLPFEETEFHNGRKMHYWAIDEIKLVDKLDDNVWKP